MESSDLDRRTSSANLLVDILLVESKGLGEHASQLPHLLVERLLVRPGQRGVEYFTRDALDMGGNGEVEGAKGLVLCLEELARVDGVDDAAGVLEWATLANTILATSPTSVDEPTGNIMLGHTFSQHLGVATGVEDNERGGIAGGEGGYGLENTVLSSGSFPRGGLATRLL